MVVEPPQIRQINLIALGTTFRYIYSMRMTLQAIDISNRSIRVRFDCLCSERPPACCKGSPMTNRLLDSSMPISSPAPHRSRFAYLPRTCDRAATQLPASFNPMQQPPLVLALGWTLHARRKSLKARARPSCRALDEQRVARRPTVPSVQHCPGADRARRYPPSLLLILLVKGGLSVLWPEICRSIWRCQRGEILPRRLDDS